MTRMLSLATFALTCVSCAATPSSAPKAPGAQAEVRGRLPPNVIQSTVRQNFGRFRPCYEDGLRNNPNLKGRVVIRFVIGLDGKVSQVASAGSDLPDDEVISCIVRAFDLLLFPKPEGGVVTVTYPIMFSPGEASSPPRREPAPPGFFAGCFIRESRPDNVPVLHIKCDSRLVLVSDQSGPMDTASVGRRFAQFEARFSASASPDRRTVVIDGKACWTSSVAESGKGWSTLLTAPAGPQATRVVYCSEQTAAWSSSWCAQAFRIFAKDGAPRDLLRTP